VTSHQLSEWEAYDRLEPIGAWRADFRMAFLASLITNTVRQLYGKKGAKMTSPTDFMPDWGDENIEPKTPPQSVEEMKEIIYAIASVHKKKKS
jgi:hypothetical protein